MTEITPVAHPTLASSEHVDVVDYWCRFVRHRRCTSPRRTVPGQVLPDPWRLGIITGLFSQHSETRSSIRWPLFREQPSRTQWCVPGPSLVRHWVPQGGARYASKMERTDKTNTYGMSCLSAFPAQQHPTAPLYPHFTEWDSCSPLL